MNGQTSVLKHLKTVKVPSSGNRSVCLSVYVGEHIWSPGHFKMYMPWICFRVKSVRPGMLRFMGSQRVGHDWATELNWTETSLSLLHTHRLTVSQSYVDNLSPFQFFLLNHMERAYEGPHGGLIFQIFLLSLWVICPSAACSSHDCILGLTELLVFPCLFAT